METGSVNEKHSLFLIGSYCINFIRNRPVFFAVVLIWSCFYVWSEFPSEEYRAGGGLLDTVQIAFNVTCFLTCLLLIAIQIVRRKFIWYSDALIVATLLLLKATFSDAIAIADLGIKAVVISTVAGTCTNPKSNILAQSGFEYCYSWMHFPDVRFVVRSPAVDLTRISNWSPAFVNELSREPTGFNLIACGNRYVYRVFADVYLVRSYCQ